MKTILGVSIDNIPFQIGSEGAKMTFLKKNRIISGKNCKELSLYSEKLTQTL